MWRSLLFVPVLNHRLVKSATRCYADAIVLDLEAAVPEHRKAVSYTHLTLPTILLV